MCHLMGLRMVGVSHRGPECEIVSTYACVSLRNILGLRVGDVAYKTCVSTCHIIDMHLVVHGVSNHGPA